MDSIDFQLALTTLLDAIRHTLRTEVTSIWLPIQLGLIAFGAAVAATISLTVRKRVDFDAFKVDWPPLLRATARAMVVHLGTIAFILTLVIARVGIRAGVEHPRTYLLRVAISLITAWLVINVLASFIHNRFANRVVAISAWTIAALSILGLLDPVTASLDSPAVSIVVGDLRITPLLVLKTTVLLLVTLWAAHAISSFVERRVQTFSDLTPSIQVLIGKLIRQCEAIEASPGGLSAAMFWGNPFTDVPDLCSNSLVVSDGDIAQAKRDATDLAEGFWADRARMQAPLVGLEAAVRQASDATGSVILIDAADAPSSGASGDSNAIIRALIEYGYAGRSLIPIVDAPAVRTAFAAGIGATIRVTLGGTLDSARFTPVPVEATIRMLSDGRFISESHGIEWYARESAVLEIGNHTVIATSRAVSLYDRSLFLAHGQDPTRFDLIVQKSPHCQHRFFAEWAERLIGVDAPGSTSANLPSLGHSRCHRPMYPMEPDATFIPTPLIFQRDRPG